MAKKDYRYANSQEHHAKTLVVYANESNVLHYDAELKDVVTTDIIEELFVKGLTIATDDVLLKPIAFTEAGVVCHNGTEAVTFAATKKATE